MGQDMVDLGLSDFIFIYLIKCAFTYLDNSIKFLIVILVIHRKFILC